MKAYAVRGVVQIFPQKGGWHYVSVPREYSEELAHLADRGLVAVRATAGEVSWDTSLLPMGDGMQFIALPAKVRRANGLAVGGRVTVTFVTRLGW
ncbi:MAG: DUF1905 domain-containing protein [Candidatus Saccharibacteria bacterium]|nr:DUF1905 domain-containing protein [Candidatus Saccharibacteria bacterium]